VTVHVGEVPHPGAFHPANTNCGSGVAVSITGPANIAEHLVGTGMPVGSSFVGQSSPAGDDTTRPVPTPIPNSSSRTITCPGTGGLGGASIGASMPGSAGASPPADPPPLHAATTSHNEARANDAISNDGRKAGL
jgi:hypothetical protein